MKTKRKDKERFFKRRMSLILFTLVTIQIIRIQITVQVQCIVRNCILQLVLQSRKMLHTAICLAVKQVKKI
jgi:hypothetical protein